MRRVFEAAPIESKQDFLGVHLADDAFDPPQELLRRLSLDLGVDVFWLGFQSLVDAFQFHHWHNGQHLRSLVYGCIGPEERTWERAEGAAEPWEATVLFDPEELDYAVENAQSDPAEEERVRCIWRDKVLDIGASLPSIDSRECAHKVAAHYGLPHYG